MAQAEKKIGRCATLRFDRLWMPLAALLLVWALLIVITGGLFVEWRGLRVSSRQPFRPLLAAALVVGIAMWRYGISGVRRDFAACRIDLDRWSLPCAVALSVGILGIGVIWGTRIAGGSDSYGYVSQSRLWLQGNLIVAQPIVATVPWPDADRTFAPLGYTPWKERSSGRVMDASLAAGHAIVPIYAPGLPMLMALLSLVHADGVFWVVPLAGAGLVLLAFALGRSLAGPGAGLFTAALIATSPTFLFQLLAPMSDVPVAAFWVAALVLALPNRRDRWLGSGLASSFAILTRPNTVPIAAVFLLASLVGRREDTRRRTDSRARLLNALAYAAGTLPGVLCIAAIHTALYGSPFESGYGTAADIYALKNLPTNLARYPTWLVGSEGPLVCLAAAAPFLVWRSGGTRWPASLAGLVAAAAWLCYLPFRPFEEWWYLRFLLTSFPCLLALTALSFTRILATVPIEWRMPLAVALLTPMFIWRIDYTKNHGAFEGWRVERRYADAGRYVADHLPPNAVLYSGQQSGSLRYYGGRMTLRWDVLDPAWLDRSIEILKGLGYAPFFVLEDEEEGDFRGRFGTRSLLGGLNWPPLAELETTPVVRVYDATHH